jgi:hypothetical protein
MKRSQIEMIEVRMGQKDEVNPRQLVKLQCRRGQALRSDGNSWQPNPDTREQHRIGKNFYSKEIDQYRGVADPSRG